MHDNAYTSPHPGCDRVKLPRKRRYSAAKKARNEQNAPGQAAVGAGGYIDKAEEVCAVALISVLKFMPAVVPSER